MARCQPVLTVNGEREYVVNVAFHAGELSFDIKSLRLFSWRVKTNYKGYGLELTPDVSTGVLVASWNANTQASPREFEITIWGEGGVSDAKAIIRIIQAKSELTISGQTNLEKTFSWEGGAARFDVSGLLAGQDYTVSGVDASWMSIQKKSDHFFLIVTANDSKVSGRIKTITVSRGNQTVNIQVSQLPCVDKEVRDAQSHVGLGGLCAGEETLIPFYTMSYTKETKHGLLNSRGEVICLDCYSMGNTKNLYSSGIGNDDARIWINNNYFIQIFHERNREEIKNWDGEDTRYYYRHRASLFSCYNDGIKEVKKYELLLSKPDPHCFESMVFRFKNGDFVIVYLVSEMIPNTDGTTQTQNGKKITKAGKTSRKSGVATQIKYYLDYFRSDGILVCMDSSYAEPDFFEAGIVTTLHKKTDGGSMSKEKEWDELSIIKREGTKTKLPRGIDAVYDISDGIVLFYDGDKGRYGYSDLNGKIIIPAKFRQALPFSEGYALVRRDYEKFFIDIRGKKQKLTGDFYGSFSEGMAATALLKNLIFVNKKDEIEHGIGSGVLEPVFSDYFIYSVTSSYFLKDAERLFTFHDGVAIVREKTNLGIRESLIDKYRGRLTDRKYNYIYPWENGLFIADDCILKKNGESVFEGANLFFCRNDGTGKIVIVNDRWSLDSTGVVFDGETTKNVVKIHATTSPSIFSVNDIFGYYNDTLGVVTIPPRFNDALPFSEELAAVKIDSRWGFIDEKGELVIPTVFEQAKPFSNGRAEVVIDGKTYYIDKKGTILEE